MIKTTSISKEVLTQSQNNRDTANVFQDQRAQSEPLDDFGLYEYENWIKQDLRVCQMVDTDKTPLIVFKRDRALVIFPRCVFGETGIINKRGQGYFFSDDSGTEYECPIIEITIAEAKKLARVIASRYLSKNNEAGLSAYSRRMAIFGKKR